MAQEIGPVSANFVNRALDRAERQDAAAWILMMDTPGGLISSTDDIVQRILAAEIPVVVFVSPAGARAASAGTFITMAAHVAVMAPNTQIGAAHPVAGGGEDIDGDLGDKFTNDAAADIRGIAKHRGRNEEWAEDAVRKSVSITGDEAVELNVVDFTAADLNDLLAQLDGRTIALDRNGDSVTLDIAGAPVVETNYNFAESILDVIADPNIAFLFTSIGSLLLLIEAFSPGLVGPGGVGVIMLIFGFFALGPLDTIRPASRCSSWRSSCWSPRSSSPASASRHRGDHCACLGRPVADRRCVGRRRKGGRSGRWSSAPDWSEWSSSDWAHWSPSTAADRSGVHASPQPSPRASSARPAPPTIARARRHRRRGGRTLVRASGGGIEIVEGSTVRVIGMEGLTAIVESLEPPESDDE